MGEAKQNSSSSAAKRRIVYILERFPADTLNFVYNEIDVLEQQGCKIDIYSLLPSIFCPVDAEKYLDRTTAIKPVPVHFLLLALVYYFMRRPLAVLSLLVKLPLDNRAGWVHKWPRSVSHVIYGIYFAYLLRGRTDHIHAHFAHKAATAALCAARLNGSTFSFTAHGSATIHEPSRYSLRTKIRDASFIIAISEFNRQVIMDLCPDVLPERVFVNRTGILVHRFPFSSREKRRDNILRVLCVASLYPIKNHEGMLEAFGLLAQDGVSFHLDLVGKDDGGRWPGLNAQAKSLGIVDNVTFHGVADHSMVAAKLAEADLMILTSHSEGIPVSMMESMSVGTPVLGPRVTGVPELVDEEITGWLASPSEPLEFAAVMSRVASARDELEAVRGPARKKIESEYDMMANAEKLSRIFQEQLADLN